MKNTEIISIIEKILQKVFKINLKKKNVLKLKIGDFKEWDSLGNFNLLLEIEKNFKIRFKQKELSSITSVNQIISYLKKK